MPKFVSKLTKEQRSEIIVALMAGEHQRPLAAKYGVVRSTIGKIAQTAGVKLVKETGREPTYSSPVLNEWYHHIRKLGFTCEETQKILADHVRLKGEPTA